MLSYLKDYTVHRSPLSDFLKNFKQFGNNYFKGQWVTVHDTLYYAATGL